MERGSNYPNGADASAAAVPVKTTLSIVQERFKADETVHLVSYLAPIMNNRLLVLPFVLQHHIPCWVFSCVCV